ncbi:MAG: peptidylprolyl isomerase [Planctomycetota bacterium]|jgi:parvulin-like peptidyl-prolyl isomerase
MTLSINGEKIEDSQIQEEFSRLQPHYEHVFNDQSADEQKAQLLEWSKENVIERVLLNQQAKKLDKEIPAERIDAAIESVKQQIAKDQQPDKPLDSAQEKSLREEIEMQMKVEMLLEDICKDLPEPPKEKIKDFYDEHKEHFKSPEQLRVSHLVKHPNFQTDETAAQQLMATAKQEIEAGATFEEIASKYSDCPDNSGDLGYITKGQMVEEFEDVVFNMNVGQVSDVFHTRFGFHIAKLNERKPSAVATLEEVKDGIVKQLKEQIRTDAINAFVDKLKEKAKIEDE